MSKFSKTLICLVAVLAFSAIVASAASAAKPEFKPEGAHKFTSKNGAATLEVVDGEKVTCTGGTGTGETSGKKALKKVTLSLTGCSTKVGGLKVSCGTSGTITTKELEGQLEYLPAGTTE